MNMFINEIMEMNIQLSILYEQISNIRLIEQNIKSYPRDASAQIYPTTDLPSRHAPDLSQWY